MKPRILYLANNRLPTEKAHGLQIAKTAEALIAGGSELLILAPNRVQFGPMRRKSLKNYYNLDHEVPIKKVWVPDLLSFFPDAPDWIKIVFYYLYTSWFTLRASFFTLSRWNTYFFSRDIMLLLFPVLCRKRCFYEAHNFPSTSIGKFIYGFVLRRCKKVFTITHALRKLYIETFNLDPDRVIVSPDGTDVATFSKLPVTKKVAISQLNLPKKKIILYTGNVYKWKGVYTLVSAALHLKRDDYEIVIVGGDKYDGDLEKLKRYITQHKIPNCTLTGHKPYSRMPYYLAAADVVVLPTSAKEAIGNLYTSPLKLFEYMASGIPIVASDVPSSREILDTNMAIFFKADDAKSLATALDAGLSSDAKDLGRVAKKAVKDYDWSIRGKNLLEAITSDTL